MFSPLCRPLVAPRYRGGWRQQAKAKAAAAPADRPPPRQALSHLLDWGDGVQSARKMVGHMADAVEDGEVTHPMVHRLAGPGADCTAANAARCVFGMMRECGFCELITEIRTPLVSHCVLPSSMLKHIYEQYPQVFATTVGADCDKVRSFWATFRGTPEAATFLAGHPLLQGMAARDWQYLIPLTVHEDAGPYAKKKSCNVISFSSLLGEGSEKLRQWPIASYIKAGPSTSEQIDALWVPLLADFRSLVEDRICGPWRFILMFAKADLENRSNAWGLPHYNSADQPCAECLANRTTMPFTDLRASAAWRSAPALSYAAYTARCRAPLHPLVSSVFRGGIFPAGLYAHLRLQWCGSNPGGVGDPPFGDVGPPLGHSDGCAAEGYQRQAGSILHCATRVQPHACAAVAQSRIGWMGLSFWGYCEGRIHQRVGTLLGRAL